jgi:hypothetical protein
MTEASEEAEEEEVPGDVCSVRMVFPWAIHALRSGQNHSFQELGQDLL